MAHLLPAMYDRFVCTQSCQRQRAYFSPYANFLAALAIFGELYVVLQCQSLRDEMIIDQIKDPSGEQVCRYVQVPRIPSSQLKRVYCEAVVRYVCVC
jgi:hypothetical protein